MTKDKNGEKLNPVKYKKKEEEEDHKHATCFIDKPKFLLKKLTQTNAKCKTKVFWMLDIRGGQKIRFLGKLNRFDPDGSEQMITGSVSVHGTGIYRIFDTGFEKLFCMAGMNQTEPVISVN